MDLEQAKKGLSELLAFLEKSADGEDKGEQSEETMTREEFSAYVTGQVDSAKTDLEKGDKGAARARLVALKSEIDRIGKAFFRDGELPGVRVYQDPGQRRSAEGAGNMQASSKPGGAHPQFTSGQGGGSMPSSSGPGQSPSMTPGSSKPPTNFAKRLAELEEVSKTILVSPGGKISEAGDVDEDTASLADGVRWPDDLSPAQKDITGTKVADPDDWGVDSAPAPSVKDESDKA